MQNAPGCVNVRACAFVELTLAFNLLQWLGDFAEPSLDLPPGIPPGVYFSPHGVEETGPDDGIGDAYKQVAANSTTTATFDTTAPTCTTTLVLPYM